MKKIDTHQHYWNYNPEEYGWIGDSMASLKRDFLPGDLQPLLQESGIDGTIAVQARQTVEETKWLLELADENPFIKGVVGWVDLCDIHIEESLERWSGHPKLVGVRHVIHDEPDDQFMLLPAFLRGVQYLQKYNLTYDILIFPKHLYCAQKFIKQFPEIRFVVDHIAKPLIKDQILDPWAVHLHELAEYENVYCKVSGMVTEADWQNWTPDDFRVYLDIVFDAFGTHRVCFGSDWPVCTVAGDYAQIVNIPRQYIDSFSDDEKADFWFNNAERIYRIPE